MKLLLTADFHFHRPWFEWLLRVADRYDLRKDITFETRVTSATFDETDHTWRVQTDRGDDVSPDAITSRPRPSPWYDPRGA